MSAPTREQWLGVTRDIKANVDRVIGLLTESSSPRGDESIEPGTSPIGDTDDAALAYELGYDAGVRAGFPPVPACPSWCDGQHGEKVMGGDDWESIDKRGIEVVRCHAKHVGDVVGKVGVEIVADTRAERGKAPVTSEPTLSLDTSGEGMLTGSEARALAHLLTAAADELEYNVLPLHPTMAVSSHE